MNGDHDIGIVGLGVMGANLALNFADHGYRVAAYNRTSARTDEFLAGPGAGTAISGAATIEDLVAMLAPPGRVLIMVKAGEAVDTVIGQLVGLLPPGGVIIDGGNSRFTDTSRRTQEVEAAGRLYVGMGVSGGEEGARHGPSLMPGGSPAAWPLIKDMFQAIAARVADGTPCCDWVGSDGAGHYVKMVHNGIEYGDMQVIAEAYHLMTAVGMEAEDMAAVFEEWNRGPLDSYLIEITAGILRTTDDDGAPLVERIFDSAGQKGTGRWTAVSSLDLGVPVTLVAEAVYARILSALKDERLAAAAALAGPEPVPVGDRDAVVDDLRQALYASKIVSYAQGFMLLRAAAADYAWDLDFGGIAYLWREGCIIRSVLLERIKQAYDREPAPANLLLDPYFRDELAAAQGAWRRTVARAVERGIPIPAYSTALAFYDGYRSERLPASLIQAQRDYFGAHTYERIDRPRGEFFHTEWQAGQSS